MADSVYEVDKVIGRRRTLQGTEEYLVHWKNYNRRYSTWEPIENLRSCLHTVTEFMAKSFPMPGINATCVSKLKSSKRELRQLKKVTDIDTRRLKGIANKEMVDEILKVKKMTNELKKFKKGRGRGRKKSKEIKLCDMLGQELDEKTLGTSQLNGSIIEKTILSAIDSSSPAIQGRKRKRGRKKKNGLTNSLTDLEEGEASRLTRTTRMHGILDECVSIAKEGCIWRITFCSEKKKNALTTEMCDQLANLLHEATKDEEVKLVVLTGMGESFCSGLDYEQLLRAHHRHDTKRMVEKFKLLVELLISFPKVLVAAVNGRALGFGASLLGLCDVVYAHSKATFQMCFTQWGHPPIGCCSLALTNLLGKTGAVSMLLLNNKMLATEAWENGLVLEVLKAGNFMEQVNDRVRSLAAMSNKVLQDTKSLIKRSDQETLQDINTEECKLLLKYLNDDQVLVSLKRNWVPDVVTL
ncbi:PREDICTED: chromodomain Y-like protein 2 [Acropora digitifera]|uniref:chromodomain Y-like protein 2 n=1 Tax=Acropora digitifera TaxID=70779 RepID=UPI00077A5E30|nr:PREDICTED: chromodomain Y-like protein 2 [Acropora digitifera]